MVKKMLSRRWYITTKQRRNENGKRTERVFKGNQNFGRTNRKAG